MKKKKLSTYVRKGIFKPTHVFPFVVSQTNFSKNFIGDDKENYSVNMSSQRYNLFKYKGVTCKHCGIEGKYFALEKHRNGNSKRFHFNLYGINDIGQEIMMTKDHIIPKSKGGPNKLSNYQTLCTKCNRKKDNKDENKIKLARHSQNNKR